MSNEKKLLDMGAQCVGGDLILNHKTVGRYRHGDFYPTEDGLAMIELHEAEDAVVISETVEAKPKGSRRRRAEQEEEVEPKDAGLDIGSLET